MPRSSSSSKSSFKSKPSIHTSKVPVSTASFTPVVPYHTTSAPTLGQSIKEGFGFGIGTSIARNIVDRAFGNSSHTQKTSDPSSTPITSVNPIQSVEHQQYEQCIKEGGEKDICEQYLRSN